jgi:hypothetical protein
MVEQRNRGGRPPLEFKGHDLVLLHFPLKGAETESGRVMEEGMPPQMFTTKRVGKATVLAGDIHVPQKTGNVTYCGAPYPIRFGDDYKPRILLWEDGVLTSRPRACLRKALVTITSKDELEGLDPGDMVRVRLRLPRSQFVDWHKRRREVEERAEELGLKLAGIEVLEKVVDRIRIREEGDETPPPVKGQDRLGDVASLRSCQGSR